MAKVRYTYHDPYLSMWQSAAAEMGRRHASIKQRMGTASALVSVEPLPDMMQAVDRIGDPAEVDKSIQPENAFKEHVSVSSALRAETKSSVATLGAIGRSIVGDCAELAAKFLWAEIKGDEAQSAFYSAQLKSAVCDPRWAECLTLYLEFKAAGGDVPYRANMDVVIDLGSKTKIAIIGDWGTGQDVAINLLQQVKACSPDVVIHLGDVYYSGTQDEMEHNFFDICQTVLGPSLPVYSLCGNHDMYSGGDGYYWLVDKLGQRASYFCLQNANWQFLAMDTGHNDHDPTTVDTNMTSLEPSEAAWHTNKIQNAGNRKTVLISHHQLFSPFSSVGSVDNVKHAWNPNLFATFKSLLPQVTCWFWGHEHTLAIYDPYMGLQRGRCVGCSAVPVLMAEQSYEGADDLATCNNLPLPTWKAEAIARNNGTDYNHAFAIMTLNGANATVDYYDVPILQAASKIDSEQF
jgi:predicted phosphodiesterase